MGEAVRESAAPASEFPALVDLLRGRPAVVLAGAGCSTESGIPDYRGPWRPARMPMRYQEFMGSAEARVRYWARSAVGWARFSRAGPNAAHRAIAGLEAAGVVRGVITQNVDGLHQAAGNQRVVELHGTLSRVRCMNCDATESRSSVQERIDALNPGHSLVDGHFAPDGDAEISPAVYDAFRVPACLGCGGILKPDVVFFGESVPRETVESAWRLFDQGEVLLVLGSSLTVFSGRRFVLRAQKEGRPVAIMNLGMTRCDDVAVVRVEERLGAALPRLLHAFAPQPAGHPQS